MSVIAVIGMQWGDEGKGKIVDILSEFAAVGVRCQGGNNAGHTISFGGKRFVLGLLPSGVLRPGCTCILGGGMVIDPQVMLDELAAVRGLGVKAGSDRVFVSRTAHVVLPVHREADALLEGGEGQGRIGTTRRGIGPAYQDKAGRRGLRMFELLDRDRLAAQVALVHSFWEPLFARGGRAMPPAEESVERLWALRDELTPFVRDTIALLHEELRKGSNVLLEGAQGTLLDVDHGTYPYVTSSNASVAGALAGSGIGPLAVDGVIGISKAYATRVGEGPFPTEAEPAAARRLRDTGNEYGSMTGRPRRCGWLDLPALRRSGKVNSVRALALTKLDVLTGLDEIPVCVGYEAGGKTVKDFPAHDCAGAVPVYERWPGWKEDIRSVRELSDLPPNLRKYLSSVEVHAELEISIISVGPSRNETILLKNPFR